MNKKLNCIMLVDDSSDDNFFHEREIKKSDLATIVITKNSGKTALEYLKSKKDPRSDLIFLDINMPGMNGWEFLNEYNQLDKELQSQAIIIMLTTSDNSDDLERVKMWKIVSHYITKPLTKETMKDIIDRYF
ncbi:Response regulator receiver domain-containing protein [Chitinophaga sp. CF118]|uniref:response regulator n=1 Tax=Chitinophaga sp. CF118 TaxID=1884367 RepID=UPI0008DFCE8A|nr:response regulator [Chitinophaga sp. CF118]SFD63282.1 Response regulator receiver domain-containing protein [Chitinophaga sp. CF118]